MDAAAEQDKDTGKEKISVEGNLVHLKKGVSTEIRRIDIDRMIKERVSNLQRCNSNLSLSPPPPSAACLCTGEKQNSYELHTVNSFGRPSYLYTLQGVISVTVHSWRCKSSKDPCVIQYDGNKDGIFNFNNIVLVSHAVLMDFLVTLVCSKSISFNGFVDKMNMMYELVWKQQPNSERHTFMLVKQWIRCFIAWADLLQIGGEKMPFVCHLCDVYPGWLNFDGVSMHFRKQQVAWNTVDQIPNVGATPKQPSFSNTKPLIADASTRLLLKKFADADCSEQEFTNLLSSTSITHKALHSLLRGLYERELAKTGTKKRLYTYSFVGIWRPLLQVWASKDSIQFFLHPYVVCVMKSILANSVMTSGMAHLLSQICPVMHNLCAILSIDGKVNIPLFAHSAIEYLLDAAISCHPTLYTDDGQGLLGYDDPVRTMSADVIPQQPPLVTMQRSGSQLDAPGMIMFNKIFTCIHNMQTCLH